MNDITFFLSDKFHQLLTQTILEQAPSIHPAANATTLLHPGSQSTDTTAHPCNAHGGRLAYQTALASF